MKKKLPFGKTAISATCTCALSVLAQQAMATTPYPNIPLNWQSGTISVKPNILLFLDTSTSMYTQVAGSRKDRLQTAKDVITDVISSTREKNRWGLATFVEGDSAFQPVAARTLTPQFFAQSYYKNQSTSVGQMWIFQFGLNNYELAVGRMAYGRHYPAWTFFGSQILINVDDVSTTSGSTHYRNLITKINSLTANTNTPIPSAYYELLRYYRGETTGVPGLKTPDGSIGKYKSPIQYRCQSNHIIFISDGEPTGHSVRMQLGRMYSLDPWTAPTITNLLNDNAMYRAQPAAAQNEINAARNAAQQGADTSKDIYNATAHLAGAAYHGDMKINGVDNEGISYQDPQYPNQNIRTYTVGFSIDIPLLRNIAQRGGGEYFQANNGAALKAALESAVSSIARDSGYTNAAISVSQSANKEVTAAAATTLDPETWTSQLRFYRYNNGFDLNNYTTPIYTSNGVPSSSALISTTDGVTTITPNSYGRFNNMTFGINSRRTDAAAGAIAKSTNAREYQRLIAWLLRWNTSDVPNSNYASYRDRSKGNPVSLARYMGDVTGNILQLGDVVVPASSDGDFDRKEFLLVPSNDGMMHILTANTGADKASKPYIERLQYLPGTAQRDTADDTFIKGVTLTAELNYGQATNPKQSFLAGESHAAIGTDGEISVLNAFGQGGRGVFALMVGGKDHNGNPVGMNQSESNWARSVPMWDMSTTRFGAAGSFYNEAGYNFGTPKVGYIGLSGQTTAWGGDVRAGALITSGMDNPGKNQPALYILDHFGKAYNQSGGRTATVTPGTLLKKIPIKRAYSAVSNSQTTAAEILAAHDGLTSAQAIDLNNDGIMDLAYAGDYKGNIWRFDLRGTAAEWDSRLIFAGNGSQPLTAEPNLISYQDKGKYVVGVYFGTGSNLYQGDMSVNAQQSLYGVFDHVSDCAVNAPASGLCTPTVQTDLIQQQFGGDRDSGFYIATDADYSDSATRRGFYFNLPTGYRVITTPETVKVRGRKSYGLIWNLEYLDSSKSGANAVTCSPSSNTYGVRVITNAENGQTAQYVSWNNGSIAANGKIIVSVPYTGTSSRSTLLTGSSYSETNTGTINQGGGRLRDPNTPPPQQNGCIKAGVIGSGTSVGMDMQSIICDDLGSSLKRLSWREIF